MMEKNLGNADGMVSTLIAVVIPLRHGFPIIRGTGALCTGFWGVYPFLSVSLGVVPFIRFLGCRPIYPKGSSGPVNALGPIIEWLNQNLQRLEKWPCRFFPPRSLSMPKGSVIARWC